jgi:CBS domain containing-hemolysin-like protein
MAIPPNFIVVTIIYAASLVFCGLLSLLETSVTTLRLFRLKELALKADKYQSIFRLLEKKPTYILNTILIANNASDVIAATTGAIVNTVLFASLPVGIAMALNIVTTTFLLTVVGEIVPKNLARVYGEDFFTSTLWLIKILYYLFYPLLVFLQWTSNAILANCTEKACSTDVSEKEIQFLIDYIDQKGLMDQSKSAMLKSIFKLTSISAQEIMIPITQVVMISADMQIEKAFEVFSKHQFSRVPVYEKDINNIIGTLHFKDLFLAIINKKTKHIKELVHASIFIPPQTKVNILLNWFKEKHVHMGIVINEYAQPIGLVTLEDVLEEIVGEIYDEYEMEKTNIVKIKDNLWAANGNITLTDLSKALAVEFEQTRMVTLNGFLINLFGHVPERGEKIVYKTYTFMIKKASKKRILLVNITQNS